MVTFVKEFEQYILTNNSEECLMTLVSGSQSELYFQIMSNVRNMSDPEAKINPEIWSLLKKIKEKVDQTTYNNIKLLILLKEYDLKETSPERKKEILNEIKISFYNHVRFDHPKPTFVQKSVLSKEESNIINSKLDPSILGHTKLIEQYYTANESKSLSSLPNFDPFTLLNYIDLSKVNDKLFYEITNSIYDLPIHEYSEENLKKLANYVNTQCDKNQGSVIYIDSILQRFTYKQIEFISELITSKYYDKNILINSIIDKKYTSQLNSTIDNKEKRKILLQIYNFVKEKGFSTTAYKSNVLLSILENGIKINEYDIDLFKEYLSNPVSVNENLHNLKKETVNQINSWNRYTICQSIYIDSDFKIIISYLRHFFLRDNKIITDFQDLIKYDFLLAQYYETLVLKGEETEEIINYLSHSYYENLVKKIEITLCQHNKSTFSVDEPVIIDVDIKNVQTLFVKIFEINCENYYYNKKSPINTSMSLEGLIATYEETYSFNEKPQKLVRRNLELEKIPKRRGLFIIEMIGNGYSSRAIVQKGSLSLITRSTSKGNMLFILDENSDICKGEKTGVWFRNNFYTTNKENGSILIPYMKMNYNEYCILVNENFAELSNLEIKEENYDLKGIFHVNHESLIWGNTCKILVKPFLTINGRETNLSNLKNSKITILMTKIDNDVSIPISNVFDKINIDDEIEVQVQIPPKITSMELIFEAEIKNYSKEKMESLSFRHNITLNNQADDLVKFYLRNVKGDYILSLIGKNGEAKTEETVNLVFDHIFIKTPINTILQTNENGEIILGSLAEVNSFSVNINYLNNNIFYKWTIPHETKYSYPSEIDILESETISLPIYEKEFNNKNAIFVKMNENFLIENSLDKIELISKNENNSRFGIKISNLSEGRYLLRFKNQKGNIYINVHSGKLWNSSNFIFKNDKIIENSQNRDLIQITDFSAENDKIKIKVETKNQARVNIFLYQFLYANSFEVSQQINLITSSQIKKSIHYFKKWSNIYLSNSQLNEEIQYVFDRKYFDRFVGNNLEKPSLLMKRQFVRDTNTELEKVGQGSSYNQRERESLRCENEMMRDECLYDSCQSFPLPGHSSFHNFLANSPIIELNLKPDENGLILLENINLSDYSHIHIIAFDDHSICEENLSIATSYDIKKKDLTLQNSLDVDKSYSEMRVIDLHKTGEKIIIEDITSTAFKMIDDLDKLINFASLVNPNLKNDWNKFSFLFKLNELSEEEKKKQISNNWCHETNIFIYFKYPELFDKYVKPALKFKIEKSFIDFFLLDDKDNILTFCNPNKIASLNAFEKCLLIYSIRNYDHYLSLNIVANIELNAENYKIQPAELKRLFNILMNMKVQDIPNINDEFQFSSFGAQPNSLTVSNFSATNLSRCMARAPQVMKCARVIQKKEKKKEHFEECEDIEEYEEKNLILMNAKNNIAREAGKSKEYCETHYRIIYNNTKDLIGADSFWLDLASYWNDNKEVNLSTNFLSKNIIYRINNITELIFLMAVIDIPISALSHQYNRKEGRSLEIIPKSNLILFTKEISEAKSNINTNLLIAQNVTLNNFPDKKIDEFLINRIYVHETIVTNISSTDSTFELLIQIPEGAIPVMGSEYTKTINHTLPRYNTKGFNTYFYFPNEGSFKQYPPNAAMNGEVISKGQMQLYKVLSKSTNNVKQSLENVLEIGSKSDILDFLSNQKIIKDSDLQKIFWLLKDKDFFYSLVDILKKKGVYNNIVWEFGFFHNDQSLVKELNSNNKAIKDAVGPKFNSNLLSIDNFNNYDILNHLDYHPIINARVHQLGNDNKVTILNKELKETYSKFILYLITLKDLDSKCWLRLCYYLILQDKIEEAITAFKKINISEFTDKNSFLIQYDYIAAFLDFSTGFPDFSVAKANCKKYKEFPLLHWRELFEEIEDQLIEYDGKEIFDDIDSLIAENKMKQINKNVIKTEPRLSFTVENKSLQIQYSNIGSLFIKFYLIDLEILFSRTPFIKQNSDDFSFVQPNFVENVIIPVSTKEELYVFNIPDEYVSKNLFIEVSSISKKVFDTYFSTSLKVSISENMGEVKVTDNNLKSLSKVYVKTFARMDDGSVKFYKDGYTDLRGKFNYISLNTDQLNKLNKFSLLILHDELGSIIKECNPPENIKKQGGVSDYENYQNYRQECKQLWRTKNKI